MPSQRVRKGVSLGSQTVTTLDKIVAQGAAPTVSAAIDLVVDEYRRRQADADLAAAAAGCDTEKEIQQPGVLGAPEPIDSRAPSWTSLDP